jgi:hypothetical protein
MFLDQLAQHLSKESNIALFTEVAMCYTHIYFLAPKSEVFAAFKEYIAIVKTQNRKFLKMVQFNNGAEFINDTFTSHMKPN